MGQKKIQEENMVNVLSNLRSTTCHAFVQDKT
jgi:hypothetical protein